MVRLGLPHLYPTSRVRRPRRPDLVVPSLPGYALASFDPDAPVPLRFSGGGGPHVRHVPWPVLGDLPGVSRIFHDGRRPLPVAQAEVDRLGLAGDAPDWVPRFAAGSSVRVADGSFASFHALIVAADAGVYTAQVTMFGRACSAEFAEHQLEAA